MPAIKKYHLTLLLAPVIYLLSARWTPPDPHPALPDPYAAPPGLSSSLPEDSAKYAGSAACQSCHKDIYAAHIKTAHYLDSRPAAAAFIKGSFRGDGSHFALNDRMQVLMEKKQGRFYQTAMLNDKVIESEAFGIVIGSGRKGQTYLYWNEGQLFQLPISYYTPLNSWCNSPGYPKYMAYFNKQVHGQCMECHGTYAKFTEVEGKGSVFDSASIIYGIDCERCHGPGAAHVAWHASHPGELAGKYIVNAKHLTRQQRLDACALCHSGFRKQFTPSFTFRVGDTLDNFSTAMYDTAATATLDVHGNQYGLLTASKCFRFSDKLDCASCHDAHANEYGKMETYSQRCATCHNGTGLHTCSFPPVKQMALQKNCIDCHMPALPSQKITLQMSGEDQLVHDLVRTHRVAVYPDATREYLEKIKNR
jgi:hypothetical protein